MNSSQRRGRALSEFCPGPGPDWAQTHQVLASKLLIFRILLVSEALYFGLRIQCRKAWGFKSPLSHQPRKHGEKNHMAEYIEVEQAIAMTGLRVVLSPGVPGPWSESAKGILHVKKIPYVKVRQILGAENPALRQWTAQETAPAFIYNDERPRSIWSDQLYLAERLAPAPTLIPANLEDRARMFGLANELCGENGFGWARRLMLLHESLNDPKVPEAGRNFSTFLGAKYGYEPRQAEAAPQH